MTLTANAKPEVYHRLDSDQYTKLAKSLPQLAVTNDTSAHQAGFQLGIQLVLQKLREGWVV
jgi:hypothetical protein